MSTRKSRAGSLPENTPPAAPQDLTPPPPSGDSPLPEGNFSLTPPPAADGAAADPPPAAPRRRGRKPGSGAGRKPAQVSTVVVEEKPVDPMLITTCTHGVSAITELASTHLEFVDPGEEWKKTMGELSARWLMKLESTWLQEHPLEAQIMLHLSFYLVPNIVIAGPKLISKYAKRNHNRIRTEEDPQNALDNSRIKETE